MADSRFEVFRGYICQDFSAEEEKDEDDIEEDEEDWDDQELDAITAGALHVQPRKPPYRKVRIRSLENRKTVDVHGNFLSTDPWWEVTVSLKPKESRGTLYQGKKVIRAMRCQPSYRLRNDAWLDEGGDYGSVMVQFLTECKLEGETKDHIMRYVRNKVPGGHVTFETLFGVFEDCELLKDEKTRELVCMVKPYVTNSECGLLAKQAMENPTLFDLLPRLLPNRTVSLLKQCIGENSWKLKALETALQEKPWAFGFSTALRKETNVVLTEVSVDRFKQAGILEDMERHIQDALYCYYVLKKNCWSGGHTYLWGKGLRNKLKRDYPECKVKDWEKMWKFLEEVNAVHRKEKGKWTKIFLLRYWKAETGIVKSLAKILERKDQDLSCLKNDLDCTEDGEEEEEKEVNEEKNVAHAYGDSDPTNYKQHQESFVRNNCQDTHTDVCSTSKGEEADWNLSQLLEGIAGNNESRDDSYISAVESKCSFPEDKLHDINKELCNPMLTPAEQDQKNFKDDMSQHAAARSIRDNPFTIISGKGGCGKTHVVCTVIAEYPSHAVTMAAPTGKAASNLRKRCKDIGAFTLHQISFQYTLYIRKKKEYDQQKQVDNELQEPQFKFVNTEILVVDECSMVPITIFSNVLHALLYQGKLKKLVLLGDYRQLPSVEPGNLLSDLYRVFKQYGWSIELTTNHRSESQLIVDNATRISNQRMPVFDADKGFQLMELPENAGFDNVQFLHSVVQQLYESDESIKDHKRSQFVAFRRIDCNLLNDWCCPIYAGHPCSNSKNKFVFQTGDKICPTRNANVSDLSPPNKDDESTSSRNTSLQQNSTATLQGGEDTCGQSRNASTIQQLVEECTSSSLQQNSLTKPSSDDTAGPSKKAVTEQQLLDEAAEIALLEQLCSQHPASPFAGEAREIDTSFKEKSENKMGAEEKRICNGEIYFIKNVHEIQDPGKKKKDENITITDDDTSLCVTLRELKLKAAIRHAWARTIHTYQGSESETVIYLLGNSVAQNWKHVYTAVTRGKSKVYIIGTKSQLQTAIGRDFPQRNTELKEILMEEIIPMLTKMQREANGTIMTQTMGGSSTQAHHNKGPLSSQAHNAAHVREASPDGRCKPVAPQLSQVGNTFVSGANQLFKVPPASTYGSFRPHFTSTQSELPVTHHSNQTEAKVFRESSHHWNQKTSCSPVKPLTSTKDPPKVSLIDQGLIHSTPKKPTSSFVQQHHSKENNVEYDDWSNEWSDEDIQQVIGMEETALADTSRNATPPLFEDETDLGPNPCSPIVRPKPLFQSTHENNPFGANSLKTNMDSSDAESLCKDSIQLACNTSTSSSTGVESDTESMQGQGYESPPPTRKQFPHLKVSPFTPNSSARLTEAWSLKSPPKNVAKRLYTQMKESPITDGLPYKKRNDMNE